MSHVPRVGALLGLSTTLVAAIGIGVMPTARADINYDASAAANAFDLTLVNESIPLGIVPEAEGPLAQVRQTSLDTSDAFAAFPYPGDSVAQLPGLLGGLVGVPVPSYPLMAQTSNGDKPATTSYPGIELQAQSADTVTRARAVAGSAASGGTSTAQVVRSASGGVSATASGDANGLVLGDVLTISGAHSEATVRRDENGTLTREGHLSFSHIGVPGLKVTIPTGTPTSVPIPMPVPIPVPVPQPTFPSIPLPFGGQTLPAPDLAFSDGEFAMTLPGLGSTRYAVPAQAVLDGLAAVGIKADYQAGRQTRDGVVSPGLVLTTVLPAPPSNPAGVTGPSTVTMTFGLTTASVSASVLTDGTDLPGGIGLPAPDEPLAAGATPLDAGVAAGLPFGLGGVPPATAPQEAAPGSLEGLQLTRLGKAQNLSWLYLLFVASALLCFASTTILRFLGVRVRWHS